MECFRIGCGRMRCGDPIGLEVPEGGFTGMKGIRKTLQCFKPCVPRVFFVRTL